MKSEELVWRVLQYCSRDTRGFIRAINSGSDGKGPDSGYILKAEPTGFPGG